MRYAGLCSVLLLIPAACDDAVGSGYPDDTASAVIEATRAERAPAEAPVSGSEANAAEPMVCLPHALRAIRKSGLRYSA
jgi:hypothetical protein